MFRAQRSDKDSESMEGFYGEKTIFISEKRKIERKIHENVAFGDQKLRFEDILAWRLSSAEGGGVEIEFEE